MIITNTILTITLWIFIITGAVAFIGDIWRILTTKDKKMGFDASEAVEPLDYDFTKFIEGAKGTIPEPTDKEVRKFERALRAIDAKYNDLSGEQMAKVLENLSEEEFEANRTASLDALRIITKDNPAPEVVEELPFRVKQKFYGWVMRELLRPEV